MASNRLIAPIISALLALHVSSASGHTWLVRTDGTGDFTDVQPAVEASAAGDTILIGPGRFDTFHPCVAPAWTEEAVVWVTRDNLTFIGSGQDVTIIGPSAYYAPYGFAPKGICSIDEYRGIIRNMTIENVKEGLYWWGGGFLLENCRISGDNASFVPMLLSANGATIRNCTVDTHSGGFGCLVDMMSRDIAFEGTSFLGMGGALVVKDSSVNVRVAGCSFTSVDRGITCDGASSTDISDCSFDWIQNYAISVTSDSRVDLERVHINHAAIGILAAGGGAVTGANVVIEGTWAAGVWACCNAFVTVHNSHLLSTMGHAVRCEGNWVHPQMPDLTNCYWGTTSADEIRSAIWDASDTQETNGVVTFEPFANGPVPTETTSWGNLKARFR